MKHTATKEITSGLAEDCLNFEQVFDQIPVFSLYETAETRIGGLFGPKLVVGDFTVRNAGLMKTLLTTLIQFIGEGLAKTNTKLEILRGVKADHNDICCIKVGSYELGAMTDFVESCIARVRKLTNAGKQDCETAYWRQVPAFAD